MDADGKKCVSRVDVVFSLARARLDARFPRAQVARFKVLNQSND
jgi:hypothetical protein